jgi:hypothetical protein
MDTTTTPPRRRRGPNAEKRDRVPLLLRLTPVNDAWLRQIAYERGWTLADVANEAFTLLRTRPVRELRAL